MVDPGRFRFFNQVLQGLQCIPQPDEVDGQVTPGRKFSATEVLNGMAVGPKQPTEPQHSCLAGSVRKEQGLCLEHLPAGIRFRLRSVFFCHYSMSGSEYGGAAHKKDPGNACITHLLFEMLDSGNKIRIRPSPEPRWDVDNQTIQSFKEAFDRPLHPCFRNEYLEGLYSKLLKSIAFLFPGSRSPDFKPLFQK